jgi:hypothetical protein
MKNALKEYAIMLGIGLVYLAVVGLPAVAVLHESLFNLANHFSAYHF